MLIQIVKQKLKFLLTGTLLCASSLAFSTMVVFDVGIEAENLPGQLAFKLKINGQEAIVSPDNGQWPYFPATLQIEDKEIVIEEISVYSQLEPELNDDKIGKVISYWTRADEISSYDNVNGLIAKFAKDRRKILYAGGVKYEGMAKEAGHRINIHLIMNKALPRIPYYIEVSEQKRQAHMQINESMYVGRQKIVEGNLMDVLGN